MAKTSGSAVLPDGTFDKKLTRLFVKDIEKVLDEMDSQKGEYMAQCKSQRERIAEIKDRAKDAGIPKKVMNEHIKRRLLEQKLEACGEFDDVEDTTQYKQMWLALEDDVPATVKESLQKAAAKKSAGMPGADAPATH